MRRSGRFKWLICVKGITNVVYSGAADGRVICTVKERRWTLA